MIEPKTVLASLYMGVMTMIGVKTAIPFFLDGLKYAEGVHLSIGAALTLLCAGIGCLGAYLIIGGLG